MPGVEATLPNLGAVEGDRHYSGADRLGLEAVGISLAIGGALIRTDTQTFLAFQLQGGVDHDTDQLR
jgi:hypothetical protein